MTPRPLINRLLIFAAILVLIPLLFPNNVYSQGGRCSRWEGFKRITYPCATPTPRPPEEDVYVPPSPEEIRSNEAREQNDLGIKAQQGGNWRLAAQYFQAALEKQPNSTQYRDNLNNAVRQIEIEDRKAREAAKRREQESLRAARQKLEAGRDKGGIKPIGGSDLFELKPSNPGSSDLRPLDNRIERNFGKGHQAVWKQLNCAVDLMGQALAIASPEDGAEPAFTESRNLLGEALNALNGDTNGVPCSMGDPLPRTSGPAPDLSRAVKKERDLIERAKVTIDDLEKARRPASDQERIAIAHAQSEKNREAIAQRDAEALKQPRKKRSSNPVVVPSPPQPPKSEAKLKIALEKLQQEAQAVLVSFPVIQRRRSPPPAPTPRPRPQSQ